jgi:DNA (cytosine-5)-methyltransferase 1
MRSVELFTGAGGLALGLERAGFEPVALFERDADACQTLRLNRPRWNIQQGDVRDVDFCPLGPVDFVAGGPPCQPFSMGGKARGHRDTRDMFPQAVRAVRELRPAAFMFENVRGLLRQAFANYVEYIRLQLTYPEFPISDNLDWDANLRRLQRHHTSGRNGKELIYRVSIQLANAADYGVPQHRHRVFFVGFRQDLNPGWFFPAPTHNRESLLRDQFVTNAYWKHHGIVAPAVAQPLTAKTLTNLRNDELPLGLSRWQTVRDALRDLPAPQSRHRVANHVFQPGARAYPGHTGSPLDEPSKALKAGDHGVPGGENMLRHPDGQVRYYTLREAARIQTFPDDYRFISSWSESMRQLGNAVPVELARVVATSIADHLRTVARTQAHA